MSDKKRLLDLQDVSIVFGGLRAVSNLTMHIDEGELVGLIGPNGAGKTTAFNMITGVYLPTEGQIYFDGKLINGKKSYQVTQMGMARTFQNIRLFSELSVLDNVKIAYNMHINYSLPHSILRVKRYFDEEKKVTERGMELLKLFHLDKHAYDMAKNLPYGAQRRLEIARALATKPQLLLLDGNTVCVSLPAHRMRSRRTNGLSKRIWAGRCNRMDMLTVEDINVYYGAIHAIKGISLSVAKGGITTLIGSNGAGKSTTLHTISGLLKPKTGKITFEGQDITGKPAHKIVGMGLSQVPEGRHVFANMTVLENLELGAYLRRDKEEINKDLTDVFTKFPRLLERKDQIAGTLSGGEQQMLAMGRALMSRPRLMLLDEPSMGLAPLLVQEIFNIIKEINDSGTTVLLVEQNARMALSIADKAYVLETGNITLEGTGKELLNSEAVQKAYLGG